AGQQACGQFGGISDGATLERSGGPSSVRTGCRIPAGRLTKRMVNGRVHSEDGKTTRSVRAMDVMRPPRRGREWLRQLLLCSAYGSSGYREDRHHPDSQTHAPPGRCRNHFWVPRCIFSPMSCRYRLPCRHASLLKGSSVWGFVRSSISTRVFPDPRSEKPTSKRYPRNTPVRKLNLPSLLGTSV